MTETEKSTIKLIINQGSNNQDDWEYVHSVVPKGSIRTVYIDGKVWRQPSVLLKLELGILTL